MRKDASLDHETRSIFSPFRHLLRCSQDSRKRIMMKVAQQPIALSIEEHIIDNSLRLFLIYSSICFFINCFTMVISVALVIIYGWDMIIQSYSPDKTVTPDMLEVISSMTKPCLVAMSMILAISSILATRFIVTRSIKCLRFHFAIVLLMAIAMKIYLIVCITRIMTPGTYSLASTAAVQSVFATLYLYMIYRIHQTSVVNNLAAYRW